MAKITMRVEVVLPWWWKLYVAALWLFEATVAEVDTEIATEFVLKHTKIKTEFDG
ncbi:hypothetical protein ACQU0X_14625 [Pseudovibrio ascidiaceicola]|uniref:hypothetical protein n=1 Tax=Pseudovibrio ascidiaceicola TaxID=285279 RepID=UPI003D360F7D